MTPPVYTGPVEAFSVEQAAARLGISAEHFLTIYDGPRVYLGRDASLLRFPAYALHEWLAGRSFVPGGAAGGSAWDRIGDGTETGRKSVSKRKQGARA